MLDDGRRRLAARATIGALALALVFVTIAWRRDEQRLHPESIYIDGSYTSTTGRTGDRGMILQFDDETARFEVRSPSGERLAEGHWQYGLTDSIQLFEPSQCPGDPGGASYKIAINGQTRHPAELLLLNQSDTCDAQALLLTAKTWTRVRP